jgi:hypothetical protein
VTRTGGIAGFNDAYTVAPDGALTLQQRGGGPVRRRLSQAELEQLRSLVTSDQFAAEAKRGPFNEPNCRDGFNYRVRAGSIEVSGIDCGGLAAKAPTFWKIVQLVEEAAS